MKSNGHFAVFAWQATSVVPHLAPAKAIAQCLPDLKQAFFQDNSSVPLFSGDCPLPEV
jgi:hypothetical protein